MQVFRRRRTARFLTGVAMLLGLVLSLPGPATRADTEAPASFDHAISGFPLFGGHQLAACDACHVNGVFKGTPTQCIFCHQAGSKTATTSKPPNHVPTNASCDGCHTSTSTWTGARFNHFASGGMPCATCHNGFFQGVRSPPASHIPARLTNCEGCHRSTAIWLTF